jgi:hypothetical protein
MTARRFVPQIQDDIIDMLPVTRARFWSLRISRACTGFFWMAVPASRSNVAVAASTIGWSISRRGRVGLRHADSGTEVHVDIPHGWRMRDALEGAGARYRYIEQEGGDHYLSRQSHRTAFFEELEAFLAEHLRATGNPSAEGLSD